jgi:hypothetical protein
MDSVRSMHEKIDVGQTVEGVFDIYRDQAGVLLPAAAVVFVIEAIVGAVLVEIETSLVLLAIAVQVVVSTLYTGMVVNLVGDVQDGRRDQSVEQLFRAITPVVLPLIGAGILAGIAIAIGFVLLIVPGLFLMTIWAVVAPVIVLERSRVLAAFGRSRALVRGNGWPVFGVIAIFFLILLVVGFLFGAIGASAGGVGRVIFDFVASVLTAPLVALAASVLYYRLRAVKGEAGAPVGARGVTTGEPGATEPVGPSEPAPSQPGAPASSAQPEPPPGEQPPPEPGQGPPAPPPR